MNHLEASFTGKNDLWRYLIMILAIFAATNTIGAIPILVSISIAAISDPSVLIKLKENPYDLSVLNIDPNINLLLMLFPFLVGLVAFIILLKPLHGKSLKKVINGTGSFRWNRVFITAAVWCLFSGIYLFVSMKLDPESFSLNNLSSTLIPLIILSVLLIPFQAAWEEIVFRGYLMQGFAVIMRTRLSPLIITSALFALMHILNPEVKEYGFWNMMPQYFVFGLIFGIMTILDDGAEAAIGAHAAHNVFLSILLTNKNSALQTSAVFEQHGYNPVTEFLMMLLLGLFVLLTLMILFRWWRNFSFLSEEVKRKPDIPQIP